MALLSYSRIIFLSHKNREEIMSHATFTIIISGSIQGMVVQPKHDVRPSYALVVAYEVGG